MTGRAFICGRCGGSFTSSSKEGDAVAEHVEQFPGIPVDDCVLVCDGCYAAFQHRLATAGPEAFGVPLSHRPAFYKYPDELDAAFRDLVTFGSATVRMQAPMPVKVRKAAKGHHKRRKRR